MSWESSNLTNHSFFLVVRPDTGELSAVHYQEHSDHRELAWHKPIGLKKAGMAHNSDHNIKLLHHIVVNTPPYDIFRRFTNITHKQV